MTHDDEEKFLTQQLFSARERLMELKAAAIELKTRTALEEKRLSDIENAIIVSMQASGVVETEQFKLTPSYSVIVNDIDAIPDEYIRTKTTKEVNKAAIKALRPRGNWWHLHETIGLTVKEIV